MAGLAGLDWPERAVRTGATVADQGLRLAFFGQPHRVTASGCFDDHGQPVTQAVGLALSAYTLNHPEAAPPDGAPITFRELVGGGPLAAKFAGNIHKTLADAFGGSVAALETAASPLTGQRCEAPPGFDAEFRFEALPRIPLYLRFNAADDEFPAQATLLFNRSVDAYLDHRCLYILATYLTGRLIGADY